MKILLLVLGLAAIVRTDSTPFYLTEDPPKYPFEIGTITWSEISSGGYKLAGTFKADGANSVKVVLLNEFSSGIIENSKSLFKK